ncbi:hypothetical protein [Kitasatospora terrestris]|uniref:Uncharacterized protein n=1 Tax=Kitasatospora terrestris TaxID=258051 RepID=A0ABP9DBT7_9ACTN
MRWTDLGWAFTAYVAGLLTVGLVTGGNEGRDVALGSAAGALAALALLAVRIWSRHHRRP